MVPSVLLASLLLVPLLLGGCSPGTSRVSPSSTSSAATPTISARAATASANTTTASATPETADVQAAVSRLFDAARAGDRAVWSAGLSTRDPAFAARAEMLFDNLSGLRLQRLAVTLTGARQTLAPQRRTLLGPGAEVRQVRVQWQLPGESAAAEQSVWLTLLATADGTELAGTADDAGPDTPAQPIWWLGPLTRVTRGDVTLLLGAGQPSSRWTDLTADSVQAARRRLPAPLGRHWPGVVVVEVPSTVADFEKVLGASPRAYASTAAVTRPEGPTTEAATRIVVNPASAKESTTERRLTLSHETVHVATRSASSPAPLWAVEGLAEYVAYETQPKATADAKQRLAAALRDHGVPDGLPADAAFGAGANDVTVAYAEAWTVCRLVAREHSRADLGAFYARLDSGASVQDAARDALGTDQKALVRDWRAELRRIAADPGSG